MIDLLKKDMRCAVRLEFLASWRDAAGCASRHEDCCRRSGSEEDLESRVEPLVIYAFAFAPGLLRWNIGYLEASVLNRCLRSNLCSIHKII